MTRRFRLFPATNFLLFSLFCAVCAFESHGQSSGFVDITSKAGIDFKYNFGDKSYGNILESSGSGVSILDYNGDGLMDIYFLNGRYIEGVSDETGGVYKDALNRLYKNIGNGTFTDVTRESGLLNRSWSMAASIVDFDNDGDLDIFLSNYGPNEFYLNNGDGTFTENAETLGLSGPENLNGHIKWSVGASFWDFNYDDLLDVYVGNFLAFDPDYLTPGSPDQMPHPAEYSGQPSLLYRQLSDGLFEDVTKEMGIYFPDSKYMGATIFDSNQDGNLDIFQGNDHQFNFMYTMSESGTFIDNGAVAGVLSNDRGEPTGSMHGTLGDIDGDLLIDLLVTDLKYGSLYKNLGEGIYQDVIRSSRVATYFEGKGQWGAALFDFDNDGDLDIFTANGTAEELRLQYPLLLANDGSGKFSNIGVDLGQYFNTKRSGRGAAVVDFDNDGDLDIIVSHVDLIGTPVLLENRIERGNNWIGISLISDSGYSATVGASIVLKSGQLSQIRVNQPATSYLSSNDSRIHFGLGTNEMVDSIEIKWNDGSNTTIENVEVNQYIQIKQGVGIVN